MPYVPSTLSSFIGKVHPHLTLDRSMLPTQLCCLHVRRPAHPPPVNWKCTSHSLSALPCLCGLRSFVAFARAGGTSATFDLEVHLRSGETIEFSQIGQGELGRLQSYFLRMKIQVQRVTGCSLSSSLQFEQGPYTNEMWLPWIIMNAIVGRTLGPGSRFCCCCLSVSRC